MRRFGDVYDAVDATTSTNAKVAALVAWLREAPPADAAWGLYFLTGRRLKRTVGPRLLATWALERTGTPAWLFSECMGAAGDLAETIALLVDAQRPRGPSGAESELTLSRWVTERILPLRGLTADAQRPHVLAAWDALDRRGVYLFNKLLTGELRVGVSDTLAVRAVAQAAGLPSATVAHRLMGSWEPTAEFFARLTAPDDAQAAHPGGEAFAPPRSRPYPFMLAAPLEGEPGPVGERALWQVEWKWDGIRAQLIKRAGEHFLWSRGEELITQRFPDLEPLARALPDGTVLDGEVLAFGAGAPLPFSVLQRRIGRQKLSAQILADAPAAFMAYDLLEQGGADVRALPLDERRARLEALARGRDARLLLSEVIREQEAPTWEVLSVLRRESRARGVEGFMLKRRASVYGAGRKRGEWWKWKIDPYSVDAVLVYAQPGQGRRASLLTDLTFALWKEGALLPVAKAYSGLTDEEIDRLDRWIRRHTVERFGPVRSVEPTQVFELHFEGIAPSPRHKSGVAVRFPRIARWRTDKKAEEADQIETLRRLIPERNGPGGA